MNDRQSNKLNMALKVKETLDNFAMSITYGTALASRRTILDTIVAAIPETQQDQELDTTNLVVNKDDLKKAQADAAIIVAMPLVVWAKDNGEEEMISAIGFTYSELRYSNDEDAYSRCDLVYEKASLPAVDLGEYGVDATMIAAVEITNLAFGAAIGKPGAAKALKIAAGNALDTQYALMDENFDDMDKLIFPFMEMQTTFYDTYFAARKINNIGVRHISIRGQVTYVIDGTFLPKTIITATSADGSFKKATSGQTGKYRIFSLEGNIYTVTVEKAGFVTQVIEDVGVSVEGIVDLDIQLVKE